jgi:WD40 repeat protein
MIPSKKNRQPLRLIFELTLTFYNNSLYLLFLIILCPLQVVSQQHSASLFKKKSHYAIEVKSIAPLPKILKEASGLYIDKNKNFWSHNDDRYPFLYCFDSTGNILKTVYINHPNKGWEDLAHDEENNIYIGAFGNNRNDRKDLTIYKIGSPDSIKSKSTLGETIKFQYTDQSAFPALEGNRNYDADAFIAFEGSLFIFTKNRTKPFTGYTRVYRLPQTAGSYHAELVDSVFLGDGPMMDFWVTSADVSPDKKTVALLGHEKIWLLRNFEGSNFSSGSITEIDLLNFSHKAGVSFSDNNILYIVDETEFDILGGFLYKLDISHLKK